MASIRLVFLLVFLAWLAPSPVPEAAGMPVPEQVKAGPELVQVASIQRRRPPIARGAGRVAGRGSRLFKVILGLLGLGGAGVAIGLALDKKSRHSSQEEEPDQEKDEAPIPITDNVHFSLSHRRTLKPGSWTIIDAWVHTEAMRENVLQRVSEALAHSEAFAIRSRGPAVVERGAVIILRLDVDGLIVQGSEQRVRWSGDIGSANFLVWADPHAEEREYPGTMKIYLNGLRIGLVNFALEISVVGKMGQEIPVTLERIRTGFACYATDDRKQVVKFIRSLQKLSPNLDIYIDLDVGESNRSDTRETERLIESKDVFYLFWSKAASLSPRVEAEWRAALKVKSLKRIAPVSLVSIEEVPPPEELEPAFMAMEL